jgi:transcriptional regulator with XRE-family HTH domain
MSPLVLNTTLAQRRRKELGMTLAQVGELCGVGREVIQRWETGQREPRNAASLRMYARALQVEPGELVAEPEGVAASP